MRGPSARRGFGRAAAWAASALRRVRAPAAAAGVLWAGRPDGALGSALGEGKNAVGVRIRPVAACADFDIAADHSLLCSPGSKRTGPLALRGKRSRISYVKFEGENMAEWIGSAHTTS